MKTFKLWLEEQQNVEANRKNFFDQIMRTLQATEDDLSKPLDELPAIRTPKPAEGESQPPQKGRGALVKIQQMLGNILQQMSSDRTDTESSVRAKRTMELLNRRSNDGKVSPDLYLQDLLRELFGNDFHEELLQNKGSQDTNPVPAPDDNAAIKQGQDQTMAPDMNDPTNGAGMDMPPSEDMGVPQNGGEMGMDQGMGGVPELPVPKKKPFGGQQFI